ncbi:PAS domain S-box protein [Pseudooceanicola sp. CBS1P-1]|uniref:histidine kinase n=1 Tax=Pseudooceanicola albus TaxID=2692189 RepID=A0A6L7G117_9RHOB|nr:MULTISPECIES: ATP-binding protein [Pseudooceanicola]MBT9383425.1 PAS domain S-box protein [Pseudooceanicola endophyticus]MXN16253.1 PAS domain S-box protein [Pseudooceanicola albus]
MLPLPRLEVLVPSLASLALVLGAGLLGDALLPGWAAQLLPALLASGLTGWLLLSRCRDIARLARSLPGGGAPLPEALPDSLQQLAHRLSAQQSALRQGMSDAHAIIDSMVDGVVVADAQGRIEMLNPATERLFGFSRQELLGQPIERLMPEEIARTHAGWLARSALNHETILMGDGRELDGRHRDGRALPIEVSVSRMTTPVGPRYIGVIRDVSGTRATEHRTRELVAELERSNAELDTFAYVASHDLKAPLRVIDNASRWLEEDLEPHLTEDTRESLHLLRSRVQRMERLLDDLLEYSRIGRSTEGSGRMVTGAEMLETIRALIACPPGIQVTADPVFEALEMRQMPLQGVLLNLIGNAVKHHDRPNGTVHLEAAPTEAQVVFSIRDDGPGIPPAFHDKVFEMFQTLRPRDEVDGSGMGLALVQKTVQLVGGTIELQSDSGRGTTFRVTWPRAALCPPRTETAA